MTSNDNRPSTTQWRWDRFDAKQVTSLAWASRSCIGRDCNLLSTKQAMQTRQVLQDEKAATPIIAGELHQLFHDAANITKMSYGQAWMQDGSEENMQCLAWMFYYYGTEIHKLGRSTLTHGEWVERKVMSSLNVSYVHLGELPNGHRTCIQQLYSKTFNDFMTNIMRRNGAFRHTSMVNKEQPKGSGLFKKNFKRGKSVFFETSDVTRSSEWRKVSGNRACK
jgi:hypothetical protein